MNITRWIWIAASVLLSACALILVVIIREQTVVKPIPPAAIEQAPYFQKRDPNDRILANFKKYPDRYILIVDESWRYDPVARQATHSLTLQNNATVAYSGIELRFSYESARGKILDTRTVPLSDPLPASSKKVLKGIQMRDIPPGTKSVVTAVAGASVVQ